MRLVVTHVYGLEADISSHSSARTKIVSLVALCGACAHTYQPLTGLHTPVVVDPTAPNFAGQAITVHCVPTDGMGDVPRAKLCQRVGTLFESQGAVVRVVDTNATSAAPQTRPDLVVELRARRVSVDDHAASWVFFAATFTLVPAVVEVPFALDVAVRDGSGFLIDETYLEGRVLAKFGLSAWMTSTMANRSWRRDSPKSTRRAAAEQLSTDVYAQLSQLTLNASRQRQVQDARHAVQWTP